MSEGKGTMVQHAPISKFEIRQERRWKPWREESATLSYEIGHDRSEVKRLQRELDARQRSLKVNLKALRGHTVRGAWLLLKTFIALPFEPLITLWDRWMNDDVRRS